MKPGTLSCEIRKAHISVAVGVGRQDLKSSGGSQGGESTGDHYGRKSNVRERISIRLLMSLFGPLCNKGLTQEA